MPSHSHSSVKLNFFGSNTIGIRPSLCVMTSSNRAELFWCISTHSMAIVGTSDVIILRKAFAKAGVVSSSTISSFSPLFLIMFVFIIPQCAPFLGCGV